MQANAEADTAHRSFSPVWLVVFMLLAAIAVTFHAAIGKMVSVWFSREEYSHGILIPLIAGFLIWQRYDELIRMPFRGSWAGVLLVMAGVCLQLIGSLAALYVLQQYALLIVLYGVVLSLTGWQAFKRLWVPLLVLVFMIPLPEFLLNNFSAQLQLISSQIGVWFIRLFRISVFVEGNVIDLGGYKLQVAEACDGLRYLFPLMTLSFIVAYFYKATMWKRVVLFLSSIPITILLNSFRIGTIGIMVEHWGISMAEGFLHEFQGWAVFMVSAGALLLEMMLLARVGRDRRPWREVFAVEFPARKPQAPRFGASGAPAPFVGAAILLGIFASFAALLPEQVNAVPRRESFFSFPNQIEAWTGRRDVIEQIYLDTLKLNDYVIADYVRDGRGPVNFYVAWYDSQRAGQSAHSPRSCLPGGGWRITSLEQVTMAGVDVHGTPLRVNRVQIELGNQKQLVYYWFQQRGRVITNEYLVKWYLFWDSLTRQRTDGALVRLITPVKTGESVQEGDKRLAEFAADVAPKLAQYIPD